MNDVNDVNDVNDMNGIEMAIETTMRTSYL